MFYFSLLASSSFIPGHIENMYTHGVYSAGRGDVQPDVLRHFDVRNNVSLGGVGRHLL